MSVATENRPAVTEMLLLRSARLALFSVALIALTLFFSELPGRYIELVSGADPRVLAQLDISIHAYATYLNGLSVILVIVHMLIAGLLFWRRPYDWIALVVAFALVANGVIFPLSVMYPPETTPLGARTLVEIIIFIGLLSSGSLLYLFPNGRFIPPWTKWLVLLWGLINLPHVFFPASPLSLRNWAIPLQLVILFIWSFTGLSAQIYRYVNVSNPVQRQQTKWAIFGIAAAVLGPFAYFLPFVILPSVTGSDVPNLLFNRLGATFYTFSFIFRTLAISVFSILSLLFPISFAIAIFRYKLWDIDIFINRALVYGVLTGLIAVIYLGSVVLLQQLIQSITGLTRSEVATAISTLLIAALFVPLQKRVQAVVDKRFYRRKYNSALSLASFNTAIRDEVELEPLVDRLVEVIQETIQPEHLSVWLREPVQLEAEEPQPLDFQQELSR